KTTGGPNPTTGTATECGGGVMDNRLAWLNALRKKGVKASYERQMVQFLRAKGETPTPFDEMLFLFVWQFLASGHTRLPLDKSPREWARFLGWSSALQTICPDQPIDAEQVAASAYTGSADEDTPLLLENNTLCFRLQGRMEAYVSNWIAAKSGEFIQEVSIPDAKQALSRLFAESSEEPDWQKTAAALSLRKSMLVLSGGPGTGKTTTVAKIIALHQTLADRPLRIELAAPTGKAAGRMGESLQEQIADLGIDAERLSGGAKTLHRLLPATRDRLLPEPDQPGLFADLVIVDEASMIDLSMMVRLCKSVGPNTRLILLGDKHQLASVEAGFVFSDICGKPSNTFRSETSDWLKQVGCENVPVGTSLSAADDAIVYLTRSYRFSEESGIGQLAHRVLEGPADRDTLADCFSDFPDLHHIDENELGEAVNKIILEIADQIHSLQTENDPQKMLQAWKQAARLTPLRKGKRGSEALNSRTETVIRKRLQQGESVWVPGRFIMITQNDYGLGVFNGDLGVCYLDEESGETRVAIESGAEWVRVAPGRIQHYEPAYFLTVHKSQGSEFNRVDLLMPEHDSPLLSRELLYTAITRARSRFRLLGSLQRAEEAANSPAARFTGLDVSGGDAT
ncbi:MAG: exodeoxyribonuclease V subunit alpha, partial [Balneolaceae bacterium]